MIIESFRSCFVKRGVGLSLLYMFGLAGQACGEEPSFRGDVAPVLVRKCLACHGELKSKGGYQLHSFLALQKGGESGEPAILPGKPDASALLNLLTTSDAASRMPKDGPPLTDPEIQAIRRWIAAGAKLDGPQDAQTPLTGLARWQHPAAPPVYKQPFPITAIAFRHNRNELMIGGLHEVTVWDASNGSLLRRFQDIAERTYAIVFSKDGRRMFVASGTPGQMGEVKILDAETGAIKQHVCSLSDCALSLALSGDEKRLAVAGADSQARIFDCSTGAEQLLIRDHSDWVMGIAWSPDGKRIATASRDKTAKIFDSETGSLIATYTEHGNYVFGVAFHPEGQHAVSVGMDGRVHRWIADDPGWENPEKKDKKKRHQYSVIEGSKAPLLQMIAHGSQLFACSSDLTARQFDLEKKSTIRTYTGLSDQPYAVAYDADSQRFAVAGIDGVVRIWKTDQKDEKEFTFLAAPGLAR